MRKNRNIIYALLLIGSVVLQTTLLSGLAFRGYKADVSLIILVLIANSAGSTSGQILGFITGMIQDLMSLSPLGFNALIKTISGFLGGLTEGKIMLDPVAAPVIIVLIITVVKFFMSIIILMIFYPDKAEQAINVSLIIELVINIILTPFIYLILKLTKVLPDHNTSVKL